MACETTFPELSDGNGTSCDLEAQAHGPYPHRVRTYRAARFVAVMALAFTAGFALYQRVGTTAQVDLVEFSPNTAGGFLAVGMTEESPGFVVLSALNREAVDVWADQYRNAVAGGYTIVHVRTPQSTWRRRLRGPVVVLVSDEGTVRALSVDWSVAEFARIRDGADCGHAGAGQQRRCGAPFADFHDMVVDGRLERVPAEVREFLAPHAWTRKDHPGGT